MTPVTKWSILAIALAAAACTPMIRVNVLQPAAVNLGAAKQLSVVETTGRRSAREFVISELTRQARATGYFTFNDRSEEGIAVKVAGRTVNVTGGTRGQNPDEIGVRIDVLEWSSESEMLPEKRDSKGKVTQKARRVHRGKVLLAITAFDPGLRAPLAETEFEGVPTNADSDDEAILIAAAGAVTKFLATITPSYVAQDIRMDDSDEAQKPIIEVAKGGNLDRASTEMKTYVTANPKNPAALYNMAVLLDAQGKYPEALDLYTQAIALSAKDYYTSMKSSCAKRLADQQALAQ